MFCSNASRWVSVFAQADRLVLLSHTDRATGKPNRRYEHDRPGAMLHVDVKKFGDIADGGGRRYVGRVQGEHDREATTNRSPL
jgi:hypothetical protein